MNTLGENNSNSQKVNNLLTLLNNQYQNQFSNFQSAVIQPTSQNINLIQSQKYLIKNNLTLKINIFILIININERNKIKFKR